MFNIVVWWFCCFVVLLFVGFACSLTINKTTKPLNNQTTPTYFHFSPYIPIYHKSKIEHCLCDNECGTATIACIALDAMAHIGEKQEGGNG